MLKESWSSGKGNVTVHGLLRRREEGSTSEGERSKGRGASGHPDFLPFGIVKHVLAVLCDISMCQSRKLTQSHKVDYTRRSRALVRVADGVARSVRIQDVVSLFCEISPEIVGKCDASLIRIDIMFAADGVFEHARVWKALLTVGGQVASNTWVCDNRRDHGSQKSAAHCEAC